MRWIVAGALLSLVWVGEAAAGPADGITWLGHASFRIERKATVVYVDPWKVADEPHDADLILITHPHFDHLSIEDIRKVAKPTAVIVGPPDCLKDLTGDLRPVKPGDSLTVGAVTIEAVPAYNTNKAFHPKANQWVGYIVEIAGRRIYHAGDTDVIPEMRDLKADVALLPVSGTYVMTAEEAATAAVLINPKLAVPMHYGMIIGSEQDARRFQSRCDPIPVKIYSRDTARRSSPGSSWAMAEEVATAAEITVSSRVDKVRVSADEPLTFSVTIAGPLVALPRVNVPSFEGFQVVSTGQSQSITLQGGVQRLAITLQYLLVPTEAGKHTLGPVVVEHEGKPYRTAPIEVEVTAGDGGPGEAPAPRLPKRAKRPPLRGGTVL